MPESFAAPTDPITGAAVMMSHREYQQTVLFDGVNQRILKFSEQALADTGHYFHRRLRKLRNEILSPQNLSEETTSQPIRPALEVPDLIEQLVLGLPRDT
jgi:hypothetical protein